MTRLGYFLSSEEHTGPELVEGAVLAERAGFRGVAISDHFHPWLRQLAAGVTDDMARDSWTCDPDPERHLRR